MMAFLNRQRGRTPASAGRAAAGLRAPGRLIITLGLAFWALPALAADVVAKLDEAQLVKLPERVATIVVGNPLIADATLQPGGILVVTGKGYGSTNVIALDRAGTVLLEKSIEVKGPGPDAVVVFRGIERETYSCTPVCERRITLGDSGAYFDAALNQTGNRNGQALGAGPAK
jgi:Pilus formation protein N terminal region